MSPHRVVSLRINLDGLVPLAPPTQEVGVGGVGAESTDGGGAGTVPYVEFLQLCCDAAGPDAGPSVVRTLDESRSVIMLGKTVFLQPEMVPNLYCIGDANGKLMLAHAANAQGISVVEQISEKDNTLNHLSIPAACFTHPEISMVGLTEPQAREKADKEGFEISVVKTSFKANTKALTENEGDGLAKMIFRPNTGEILGVHILGLHAADLIHEASNAIALGTCVQDIKFAVHAHPTLSEVLDELFKAAKVNTGVSHSLNEPVAA